MRKVILSIVTVLILAVGAFGVNVSTQPYGINVHNVPNEVLDKVVAAGIKWIRVDITWFGIEYQRGRFSWTQVDRVVDYADTRGLSILGVIAYTPDWANNGKGLRYPADNIADWQNFVRLTVNRYKNKVKYWSIWNEPNAEDFWALGKDDFVNRVFIPAGQAIRQADSTAFIVGPDLAHLVSTGKEWFFWLKYILQNAGNYVDIVSHHIYTSEAVYYIFELLEQGEALVPAVKEIIEETGHGSKPFWVTETGWNTESFSETVQSNRYLEMLQKRKQKSYPDKIFFYEIIDDPAPGIQPWGILRSNLNAKPAYNTYRDFIAGLYPDDTIIEEEPEKKCYADEVTNPGDNSGRSQILSGLRGFRGQLASISPQAWELVRAYYRLSDDMKELSRKDSRVLRLGRELVAEAGAFFSRQGTAGDSFWNRKFPAKMTAKMTRLIKILEQKKLAPSMKRLLKWSKKQVGLLKSNSLGKYVLTHLTEEIRTLSKHSKTLKQRGKK